MKLFAWITFMVSFSTLAQSKVAQAGPFPISENCVNFKSDPYDPGAVMLSGPFKGQCMDTSSKRAAYVLRQSPFEIVIANFYHNQNFGSHTFQPVG